MLSLGLGPGLPVAAHAAGALAPTAGEAYRAAGERLGADPAVLGAHGFELAPPPGSTGNSTVCSLGFSAYTADFRPAGITAAHCTDAEAEDGLSEAGRATELRYTRPSHDPYLNGGEYWNWERLPGGARGAVTGWQLGSPDDPTGGEFVDGEDPHPYPPTPQPTGDPRSTDMAVIEFSAAGDVLPAVSAWDSAAALEDDLHASTIPVTGVGKVAVGDAISRSGRTTGLRSGEVTLADGWLDVDGALVRGFGSDVVSDFGDSGGPVFNDAGEALGVVSAGVDLEGGGRLMWTAALGHGLDVLGNPVRVAVDRTPRADTDAALLAAGQTLAGTGAEGFTGGTYVLDSGETVAVAVDGEAWSFTLPESAADPAGRLFLTAQHTVSRPLAGGGAGPDAEAPAPEAPAPEEPTGPGETATTAPAPGADTGSATKEPSADGAAPGGQSTREPSAPRTSAAPAPDPGAGGRPAAAHRGLGARSRRGGGWARGVRCGGAPVVPAAPQRRRGPTLTLMNVRRSCAAERKRSVRRSSPSAPPSGLCTWTRSAPCGSGEPSSLSRSTRRTT